MAAKLWPFAVYAAAVVLIVAVMLGLSYVLGQRHRDRQTATPYEGGVVAEGPLHGRVASEFYLVAAFFVVFDVETVVLFAWAIAGRSLGWAGVVELAIFVGLLFCALGYLWLVGALDWRSRLSLPHRQPAPKRDRGRRGDVHA